MLWKTSFDAGGHKYGWIWIASRVQRIESQRSIVILLGGFHEICGSILSITKCVPIMIAVSIKNRKLCFPSLDARGRLSLSPSDPPLHDFIHSANGIPGRLYFEPFPVLTSTTGTLAPYPGLRF